MVLVDMTKGPAGGVRIDGNTSHMGAHPNTLGVPFLDTQVATLRRVGLPDRSLTSAGFFLGGALSLRTISPIRPAKTSEQPVHCTEERWLLGLPEHKHVCERCDTLQMKLMDESKFASISRESSLTEHREQSGEDLARRCDCREHQRVELRKCVVHEVLANCRGDGVHEDGVENLRVLHAKLDPAEEVAR